MHVSLSEYTQSLRLRAHPDSRLQIPLPTDNHQVCISGPELSPSNCHPYISTEMSYRHLKLDVSKLSPWSSPRVLLPDFPLESPDSLFLSSHVHQQYLCWLQSGHSHCLLAPSGSSHCPLFFQSRTSLAAPSRPSMAVSIQQPG